MATVTAFTAERMQEIEDGTVVDGVIVGDDLILVKHDGSEINAGNVKGGPIGPQGVQGETGPAGPNGPLDVLTNVDTTGAVVGNVLAMLAPDSWGPADVATQVELDLYSTVSRTWTATQTFQPTSTATTGQIVKGLAVQTGDLQQWQNSTGTALSRVDSNGSLVVNYGSGNDAVVFSAIAAPVTRVDLRTRSATSLGMRIIGAASQTADLQQWQDSASTTMSRVRSDGVMLAPFFQSTAANASYIGYPTNSPTNMMVAQQTNWVALGVKGLASQTNDLQQWQNSTGTAIGYITAGGSFHTDGDVSISTTPLSSGVLSVSTRAAANVGAVIRGVASQTGDLQQWQAFGGAVRSFVDSTGRVGVLTTAPSSGAALTVFSSGAANPQIVTRASVSQTGDLQQWQDSTGTALTRIGSDGSLTLNNGIFSAFRSGVGSTLTNWGVVGEANPRLSIFTDGKISLGPGTAVADTHITRESVNVLRINNYLTVTSGLGLAGRSGTSLTSLESNYAATLGGGASLRSPGVLFDPSTVNFTIAAQTGDVYGLNFGQMTVTAANASTIPQLVGMRLQGPLASTNVTATSSMAALIETGAAGNKGIVVKGATAQTVDLQDWQDSTGANVARVTASGSMVVGAPPNGSQGKLSVAPGAAGSVGVVVQAFSGAQTGDLQQFVSSTGAVLSSFTAAGLPKWAAAANVQTTVGAAGVASALPATPTKYLKVVDDTGATLVVPAYAAA